VADMDDCESRVGTLDVPGVSLGVAPNEASLLLSSFEGSYVNRVSTDCFHSGEGGRGWYPADRKRVRLVILGCRRAEQPFPAETLFAQLQLRNVLSQLLLIRDFPVVVWLHCLAVWCCLSVVRRQTRGRHDPSAADNFINTLSNTAPRISSEKTKSDDSRRPCGSQAMRETDAVGCHEIDEQGFTLGCDCDGGHTKMEPGLSRIFTGLGRVPSNGTGQTSTPKNFAYKNNSTFSFSYLCSYYRFI
jgi:hypothetical protein